jgi:hypothetical protein
VGGGRGGGEGPSEIRPWHHPRNFGSNPQPHLLLLYYDVNATAPFLSKRLRIPPALAAVPPDMTHAHVSHFSLVSPLVCPPSLQGDHHGGCISPLPDFPLALPMILALLLWAIK